MFPVPYLSLDVEGDEQSKREDEGGQQHPGVRLRIFFTIGIYCRKTNRHPGRGIHSTIRSVVHLPVDSKAFVFAGFMNRSETHLQQ
jgi:hypothetical protein